jgi:hypothetical protein
MNIILISGKQGSGKSSLLDGLLAARTGVMPLKFADPLYDLHNALLPLLVKYGLRESLDRAKDGELLQVIGTEYGRKKYGPNVWVDIAKRTIAANESRFAYCVIDDCRFRSEFGAFPNALKVRLECDMETRKARCSYWRNNDTHPSETDLDSYAEQSVFDLTLNTSLLTKSQTLAKVMQAIDKKFYKGVL